MTSESPRTVFFLSDFGTEDEFVGVVHAVIAARAPGTTVIDLTHHIPPFDVRAGSHTLARAVPYLSLGVVLAVVDPGVGTERRGIGLRVALPSGGSLCFVGPDNGLLVAAAEAAAEAPVAHVVELARRPPPPERGATFDGRDLFGPAAAALCAGDALEDLGEVIDPRSLVRLVGGVVEEGRLRDGRTCLRTEVTWVDHFGNLQLAATVADARVAGIPLSGRVELAARLESGRPASRTRCRRPSCPTACSCGVSTPSVSCNEGSSACWWTPTAIWRSWQGRPRRPGGSTWRPGSCSFSPGEPGLRWFGVAGIHLGTIRDSE